MTITVKRKPHARAGTLALAVLALCVACPRAEAHLVTTGLGPVYDGVAHLSFSPADVALAVAVTLFAAMRGTRCGRWTAGLLPLTWLAGGVAGLAFPFGADASWAMGASMLLAGSLVAFDRDLPLPLVSILVAIIGTFHGIVSGTALAGVPSAALELTGEWVALIVIVTLVAGLVVSLRAFWARIVVRVMGSWVAATGLLLVGWSLRAAR